MEGGKQDTWSATLPHGSSRRWRAASRAVGLRLVLSTLRCAGALRRGSTPAWPLADCAADLPGKIGRHRSLRATAGRCTRPIRWLAMPTFKLSSWNLRPITGRADAGSCWRSRLPGNNALVLNRLAALQSKAGTGSVRCRQRMGPYGCGAATAGAGISPGVADAGAVWRTSVAFSAGVQRSPSGAEGLGCAVPEGGSRGVRRWRARPPKPSGRQ